MQVMIVANSGRDMAMPAAYDLQKWLTQKHVSSAVFDAEQVLLGTTFNDDILEEAEDASLICSLGGDGTLLTCAQIAFRQPMPMLGFNFGHLGFLTGATPDVMYDAVGAALKGELQSESRSAMDVAVFNQDGSSVEYTVLNEVAITRGTTGKMIDYDLTIDGELLSSMRADGVIVASPTGSTAYSLSAGGPILSPTLTCMVVVALAPHSLISRALVTGQDEKVAVLPLQRDDAGCSVFMDGNLVSPDSNPLRIEARVRKDAITLLKYNVPGFTTSASRAFFGSSNA